MKAIAPYLQTQMQLMTTGRVLKEVVRHPKVVNLPMIAKSDDPEADLRKRLNIEIMDEGFLIRVAWNWRMLSKQPRSSTRSSTPTLDMPDTSCRAKTRY